MEKDDSFEDEIPSITSLARATVALLSIFEGFGYKGNEQVGLLFWTKDLRLMGNLISKLIDSGWNCNYRSYSRFIKKVTHISSESVLVRIESVYKL